ncbi:hypothetical protein TNCV_4048221 [Trichonephila clavipes]|nr:hypothetical protein TNCV_4048221 [Trichonephila clavipes]
MGLDIEHLVSEIHDNISHQEDDEPDEGCGQTNAGIWSTVVGLKKPAHMQIAHFPQDCCTEYRSPRTGRCGSCNSTFLDCGAYLPECYILREVGWMLCTCRLASTLPGLQSVEFLFLEPLEIVFV